jgi:hypothetical protein
MGPELEVFRISVCCGDLGDSLDQCPAKGLNGLAHAIHLCVELRHGGASSYPLGVVRSLYIMHYIKRKALMDRVSL